MANQTTNYGLTKPLSSEFYDVEVQNGNMDIIDTELAKRATLEDGKVPASQLPDMDYIPTDEKGVANGVATLDENGKLPTDMIPDGVGGGKRVTRFTVGSSSYGWTENDCDYLCDGTADEEEINAAITALRSTGGEVVLLDGQYNLTGSILVEKNNVTIRGNGNNTKLIRGWMGVYESRGMILIEADYCEVRNLYLDGVRGTYNDYYQVGVCIDSFAQNCRVENCMFVYHGGYAVDLSGKYSIVTNNMFENNDYGVATSYGDHNVISENTFYANEYCIKLGSDGNVVANNTMNTTTYYGIYVSSSANNTIVGNVSDGAKGGFTGSYCKNTVIVGNTFNNSTTYGIELSSQCTGNTVTGNVCIGNTSGELYLASSATDNILDVAVYLNRTTAVNVADTNYTTLMARGSSLNSADTTPSVNGAICWTYG